MKIGRIHYIRVAVQVICRVGPTNSPLLIRNKMEKVHKKRRLSVEDGARLRMPTIAAFDVIRYLSRLLRLSPKYHPRLKNRQGFRPWFEAQTSAVISNAAFSSAFPKQHNAWEFYNNGEKVVDVWTYCRISKSDRSPGTTGGIRSSCNSRSSAVFAQHRRTSATPHAWAMHLLGSKGGTASKTSLIDPTQASSRWGRNHPGIVGSPSDHSDRP